MQKRSALWVAVAVLLVVTFFALFACCCPARRVSVAPAPAPPAPVAQVPIPLDVVPAKETDTEMRNVRFHIDATSVLRIAELRGQMFDKESGKPLNFDDKRTFIVRMFNATIGVDGTSLTNVLNRYVFNYSGSPLKDLVVSVQDGHLVQEGMMHKIIDIPFRMIADVSASGDAIRIHPTKIEICNLNGAALMKAFGITLEKIMTKLPPGVRVEKNDLLIQPLAILPPPKIEGKLTAARIEADQLTMEFDDGRNIAPLEPPDTSAKNFMYFQRGTLHMGKLFMVSADMQVIDTDPSDPFDFFIDRYNEQLTAGYDHNRPNYGLTVYMRDFEDIGKPPRPGERLLP